MGRGIGREGLFFSLRSRLLNEGAVIYNSPDFQGRREKCGWTMYHHIQRRGNQSRAWWYFTAFPTCVSFKLGFAPRTGMAQTDPLVPLQCPESAEDKRGFLLSPWPWSSPLLCWLEYQEQAPDDCGNWLLSLYLLSQEAETIFPALESGLGLWLALTDGMKLRSLQVSPFQPPQ